VAMKNRFFWDVTPRGSCKNRRYVSEELSPSIVRRKGISRLPTEACGEDMLCEKPAIIIVTAVETSSHKRRAFCEWRSGEWCRRHARVCAPHSDAVVFLFA
jgi:hypothetical protein